VSSRLLLSLSNWNDNNNNIIEEIDDDNHHPSDATADDKRKNSLVMVSNTPTFTFATSTLLLAFSTTLVMVMVLTSLGSVAAAGAFPWPFLLETTSSSLSLSSSLLATTLTTTTAATSVQQESLSGFIAGFLLTFAKTLVRYPLDTATVRLQVAANNNDNDDEPYYSIWQPARLLENCYRGFALSFLSTIPAGAFYFAVKDAVTHVLSQPFSVVDWLPSSTRTGGLISLSLPSLLVTMIAVALAQLPYWIIRNPSEVVKTRQQAELDGFDATVPVLQAYQRLYATEGWKGFYTGYWENVIYSYPSDVIKFTCYGYWVTAFAHAMSTTSDVGGAAIAPTPVQGAMVGALVTVLAQYSTTPLDVVRNRLMTTTQPTKRTFGTKEEQQYYNQGARQRQEKERHHHDPHHHSLVSMNAAARTMESSSKSSMSSPPPSIALYAQALVQLAQQEGLKGLFAGGWPTIIKSLIIGAIQFATYEQTKLMMLATTSHL